MMPEVGQGNGWHNRAAAVGAPLEKRAVGGSAFMPLLSVATQVRRQDVIA